MKSPTQFRMPPNAVLQRVGLPPTLAENYEVGGVAGTSSPKIFERIERDIVTFARLDRAHHQKRGTKPHTNENARQFHRNSAGWKRSCNVGAQLHAREQQMPVATASFELLLEIAHHTIGNAEGVVSIVAQYLEPFSEVPCSRRAEPFGVQEREQVIEHQMKGG